MGGGELFENLPEQTAPERQGVVGAPRLREPMRDQIELRAVDLNALLSEDHPARLIWAYVEKLDLRVLEDRIMAREGRPGHPPEAARGRQSRNDNPCMFSCICMA